MATSEKKIANKYATLVTYLIALACLIVGLFVPLFDGNGIMALQLPAAFNCLLGKEDSAFTLSYKVTAAGIKIDVMAIIVLAYTVVTALGVLALIPILLSKKSRGKAYIFAGLIEVLAALVLSLYAIAAMQLYTVHVLYPETWANAGGSAFSYNMLIALGGTLLMLILQGFICKKGGFAKLFYFLFSAIAVIALFNITIFVTYLEAPFAVAAEKTKLVYLMYGSNSVYGFEYVIDLVQNFSATLAAASTIKLKILLFGTCALVALVLINYVLDVIGLATKPNYFSHIFNCIRFGLEIALIICVVVVLLISKVALGFMLLAIALMAVLQFIMSVSRCCMYAKARQRELETKVNEKFYTEVPEPATAYNPADSYEPVKVQGQTNVSYDEGYVTPVASYEEEPKKLSRKEKKAQKAAEKQARSAKPVAEEQYTPAQEPAYEAPAQYPAYENVDASYYAAQDREPVDGAQVYVPLYKGPVDNFIKKLSNNERIEFSRIFIDKAQGDIGNIPDYVIGGDNKKFFSAVFIYLGKVRSMVSDGLLNKMYKEINMF